MESTSCEQSVQYLTSFAAPAPFADDAATSWGRKGPDGHQVHTPGKEPDVSEDHWAPSPLDDAGARDAFRTAIRTPVQVHYLLSFPGNVSSRWPGIGKPFIRSIHVSL